LRKDEFEMRFLVIYAHPLRESFQAAVHEQVVKALSEAGHHVDDCDLYAEGFPPVLTREERRAYHDVHHNRRFAQKEIDRLLACEGLIFVFPVWWYGMPAILKGYVERVWIPGVAFNVIDGRTRPLLNHIKRFAVITSYGSPWWENLFGDPNRRVFMRGIRHIISPGANTLWLALYGMDYIGHTRRQQFLKKVYERLRRF
jgi:putative NADPH-quinone reductase